MARARSGNAVDMWTENPRIVGSRLRGSHWSQARGRGAFAQRTRGLCLCSPPGQSDEPAISVILVNGSRVPDFSTRA